MPNNFIKSVHEKTGIPIKDLEKKWKNAKKISGSQYNITENDESFWPITVGIFKKSLGDEAAKVAAHIEAFVYVKAGTDVVEFLPEIDHSKIKASVINKAYLISKIPKSLLSNKWDIIEEAILSTYGIKQNDIQFLPKVIASFKNHVSSLNPECGIALASAFNYAIDAAPSKAKLPSATVLPLGINPEAVPVWRETVKSKKKTINQFKDNMEKWAAAIVLFKRACAKKGINPWLHELVKKKRTSTKEPSTTFLSSYADPCIRTVEKMEKFLQKKDVLTKRVNKKFKMGKLIVSGRDRILTASKNWTLRKTEEAAETVLSLIPKFGLRKNGDKSYRAKKSSNSGVTVKYAKKTGNTLTVSIDIKINSGTWKSIVTDKKDPKKFLNSWVNKGFQVTSEAEESVTEDFDYLIKTYYPVNTRDDAIGLINKLVVPTIVNLGNTDFQYKLAKYVKDNADKFEVQTPESLVKFLESKDYRNSMRKEFLNEMPDDSEEDEGTLLGPKLFKN